MKKTLLLGLALLLTIAIVSEVQAGKTYSPGSSGSSQTFCPECLFDLDAGTRGGGGGG